jgi:hypothetical protein
MRNMQAQNQSIQDLQLIGKQINGNIISCTGSQLVTILRQLSIRLENCNWYMADISVNTVLPNLDFQRVNGVLKVGKTEDLVHFAEQVDQFLSGIFLAVPISIIEPIWNRSFDTEDEPTNNLGDVLIEIRAFDTTYFEIYSSESNLLEMLVDHFPAVI